MVQSSKDQDLQSSFLVFEAWLFQLSVKPLKLETHGASAAVTSGTVWGGGKPSAGHWCLAPWKRRALFPIFAPFLLEEESTLFLSFKSQHKTITPGSVVDAAKGLAVAAALGAGTTTCAAATYICQKMASGGDEQKSCHSQHFCTAALSAHRFSGPLHSAHHSWIWQDAPEPSFSWGWNQNWLWISAHSHPKAEFQIEGRFPIPSWSTSHRFFPQNQGVPGK